MVWVNANETRYLFAVDQDAELIVNMKLRKASDGAALSLIRNQLAGKLLDSNVVEMYGRILDLNEE